MAVEFWVSTGAACEFWDEYCMQSSRKQTSNAGFEDAGSVIWMAQSSLWNCSSSHEHCMFVSGWVEAHFRKIDCSMTALLVTCTIIALGGF